MALGTVDRTPPPFFRQGPSALSKLMVFSAMAILLMVVDARMQWATPLRAAISGALYPLQWLALQPVQGLQRVGQYLDGLDTAQRDAQAARTELARQSLRATQVEHLTQENRELRTLLGMRQRLAVSTQGAQVLHDSADPYTHKIVIDQGQVHGIAPGSPVMDGHGVLGQVTRVYPMVSEVSLLIDEDQVIPVLNTRTGLRSLAYGRPDTGQGRLELRFVPANADVEVGDILTTSGVDGIYPAGLQVAKVSAVSRQGESGFARIECEPLARMDNAMHVLVLTPPTTAAQAKEAAK
jgi:rod shape-determining protein MreC